jgi:SAM-dependent methyltransferase
MSFYEEDLAHVHDTGWGGFAAAAGPGIVARLRAAGIDGGLVVSLACGSGLIERILADASYDVLGIDISGAMLEIARRRVPEASFVEASALDADLPPCAAVIAAGEGLGYLRDPRLADDALLRTLFGRVHAALSPGGLFLFDLVEEQGPLHDWFEGPDYVLALDTTATPTEISRRIVLFRHIHGAWRRSDETHRARLQPRDTVVADLETTGFAVELIAGYADGTPLRPGVVGYSARA